MNDHVYSIRMMRFDLSEDFKRYIESSNIQSPVHIFSFIRIIASSRGLWAVAHYRFGRWANTNFNSVLKKPLKIFFKTIYFLGRFFVVCVSKTDISISSNIGPGLFISNKGNVIFGAESMGKNGTIHHNVTSGLGRDFKFPIYGDHIWIGSNSIIYGGIIIDSNSIIAGNTVLSKNIKGNIIVGGNPTKILKKNIPDGPYKVHLDLLSI